MGYNLKLPDAADAGFPPTGAFQEAGVLAVRRAGKTKKLVGGRPFTLNDRVRLLWLLKVIQAFAKKEIPRLQREIAASAKIGR